MKRELECPTVVIDNLYIQANEVHKSIFSPQKLALLGHSSSLLVYLCRSFSSRVCFEAG